MLMGVDVSTLLEMKKRRARYTANGVEVDALKYLHECGARSVRVRLWVDPYTDGRSYGAGYCDLASAIRIARLAKDLNMSFLLDLHYSDFWCDPSRQIPPKEWQGRNIDQLVTAVYAYTKRTLDCLRRCKVYPQYVQTGNEITGGMLWDEGRVERNGVKDYTNLFRLLSSAAEAVRASGDAKIILHLERSGNNELYREWLDNAVAHGADYDILGISYYPFWHGDFAMLEANISDVLARYKKPVYMVETSYPFTSEGVSDKGAPLVLSDRAELFSGGAKPFPFTAEGQAEYLRAVKRVCERVGISAIYYWEPAWLPLKGVTWATAAGRRYINETHKKGGNEWANQCLFNYEGEALPAIKEMCSEVKDEA